MHLSIGGVWLWTPQGQDCSLTPVPTFWTWVSNLSWPLESNSLFCTMLMLCLPPSLQPWFSTECQSIIRSWFTGNIFNNGYCFGADANTPFPGICIEFHTASTHSSKGTMCETTRLRAPSVCHPRLCWRAPSVQRQSTPCLRNPPGTSMGGTHEVAHKSPDAWQIKVFLAELCPGPVCCQTLLDNSGTDARMARRTSRPHHLCPFLISSSGLHQRWVNQTIEWSPFQPDKREIVSIPLLNIVLFHVRGFACFFFVGICFNPLAKWIWNSRGLKGSTGEPPDRIKCLKPRRQGKIVISNWKSTGLWQ